MGVRNIKRSAKWYIDVLGFERLHDGMWNGVPTFVGKGNTGIALFPANQEKRAKTTDIAKFECFIWRFARTGKSLDAQGELKKRGIKFEFQDHEIAHSIYFRDPDGHSWKLRVTRLSSARNAFASPSRAKRAQELPRQSFCHSERSRRISS